MKQARFLCATFQDLKFNDTLNYSQSSVKELGEMLKIQKLTYTQNKIGTVPRFRNELMYLKEYNKRDCVISKTFIEEFQKAINLLGGELKLTIASCGMDLFRRKYIPCTIYKEKFRCKEFIFSAYYGGRCEAFKRGKLPNKSHNEKGDNKYYYYYDFNSLYPSVMINKYPKPSSASQLKNSNGNINYRVIENYEGVSDVLIYCPYMKYPILPVSTRFKLLFPYGLIRGRYTHIELRYAIENGYILKKVYETVYYTKTFYPFKEYVEDLYKKRMEYKKSGNEVMQQVCKLLMNSLYGKFGSKTITDFTYMDLKNINYTDEELYGAQPINHDRNGIPRNAYKEEHKECEQAYVIPIFPAYVTSYGRIKLHKALVQLNAIYCDTDSIITETKIEESKELGELKLEATITTGYIIRPKMYAYKDINKKEYVTKIKGVNKANFKKMEDVLNDKSIEQIRFLKTKEAMRGNRKPNQIITQFKHVSVEDDKRKWKKKFNKNEFQDSQPIEFNGGKHK
jgi:hypothetical protein